ncbi:glycerol-3-phosphate 1-O-acyltransferase PlsY [Acholeplasma equirhinis]|uniref:glycerol-3-phosphate 1-O-acyltransferase PlsY n=1 Tax=Acholeplasma equirhinis TaxID=555393 RepID=UPI00197AF795|nr:glycerol-3-phosphate 1-O-acyltransferase PlsY [Acholeplasma equirhinis]MBN3490290.1 glycerol-3-phosphate 1-O-acyltransferase PlsY [Acholeplasma equirhinis]
MQFLYILIALVISYLIGSIPFGFIIPKVFKNIDIRDHGSKNVGSTNVIRVLGPKYGIPVFILDSIKGALPIVIARYILGFPELNLIELGGLTFDIVVLYGAASAIGHIFSIYIGFKGGKAVATGVGAIIALNPIVGLLGIAIFFLVAFTTKYVSIGSVVATFMVGVMMWISVLIPEAWIPSQNLILTYQAQVINLSLVTLLVAFVIYKHKKNFIRLMNGTENKIGQKKKSLDDKK